RRLRNLRRPCQRARADDLAAMHQMMQLAAGEAMKAASAGERGARVAVQGLGGPQRVGVEADGRADAAPPGPATAEIEGGRVVSVTGRDPERPLEAPAAQLQLGDFLVGLLGMARARETEADCGGWADEDGVVPGELGERLGQFLKPAVVGETAVE